MLGFSKLRRKRLSTAIRAAVAGSLASAPLLPAAVLAQNSSGPEATVVRFDVPAGELSRALSAAAVQGRVQLSFDTDLTRGKKAVALSGEFTVPEAFARLLSGSELEAVESSPGQFRLRRAPQASQEIVMRTVKVQADADLGNDVGFKAHDQESATKTPLSIRETPQAISVVTRESIEARQALDINSALELSAGVSTAGRAFSGNNPRTGEDFTLRGQGINSLRDLRIDGFAAAADRNVLDLAPFEHIEAVKGPSSMLYGQGSLGGFINLVRKKPQAQRDLQVVAQAGSFDTYRTELDATGALDTGERLMGQLALAYEDSGSYIDHVDSRRLVLAPTLETRLGENTHAQLALIYQKDHFRPSLGIDLVERGGELVIPEISRSLFFGVPNAEDSEASMRHTTLRVNHALDDRWLATLMLHNSRSRLLGISDGYAYGVDDNGDTYLYSSYVAHDNESWAGEVRVDGRFNAFGHEHRLLMGLEANRREEIGWGGGGYTVVGSGNIYTGELMGGFPGHDNPRNYDADGSDANRGVYAQVLLSVAERTKLLLGGRYDRLRQKDRFVPVGETVPYDRSEHSEFTGRIAVTQQLPAGLNAYVSWAQSFNPVFEASRNGILEPETGAGYEFGLKGEWLEDRLGATVAIYRQELDNRPIPDPSNGPSESFSISGGRQRSEGLELEVAGRPLPGFDLQLASAWLDAEYIDRRDPNVGLTPGGTVKRQTSLYAAYELQKGALKGLGFGATVVSVGDRIVLSGQNYYVKGYERYDLHAFYKGLPGWTFSLLLRNLADERYIEQTNAAYQYAHFFGSPRAGLFRAEYTFE